MYIKLHCNDIKDLTHFYVKMAYCRESQRVRDDFSTEVVFFCRVFIFYSILKGKAIIYTYFKLYYEGLIKNISEFTKVINLYLNFCIIAVVILNYVVVRSNPC